MSPACHAGQVVTDRDIGQNKTPSGGARGSMVGGWDAEEGRSFFYFLPKALPRVASLSFAFSSSCCCQSVMAMAVTA